MSMLQEVLDKIDAVNQLDPNKVEHQGEEQHHGERPPGGLHAPPDVALQRVR